MTLHDQHFLCFTCAAALTAAGAAVKFANATTTTIIASISMARPSKRSFQLKEQLKEARRLKKQRGEDKALQAAIDALGVPAEGDPDRYQLQPDDSTNESSDESEEECEITDAEDSDIFDSKSIHLAVIPTSSKLRLIKFPGDVFQQILTEAKTPGAFSGAHLKYIRGPEVTQRTKERRAKEARQLASAAKGTKSLLEMGFCQSRPVQEEDSQVLSKEELSTYEREEGIKDLEKKMRLGIRKRTLGPASGGVPIGQNAQRHQAVLAFLKLQRSRQPTESRKEISLQVARCFGRGRYFARKYTPLRVCGKQFQRH